MKTDEDNKYRVVCTRDCYNGDFFVDIVPAKWAIHQVIHNVRHEINPRAHDVAGAIFLTDNPNEAEPKIEFLAKKDHLLMSDYWEYDEKIFSQLEKMIQQKFADMKKNGIITTIPLYDLDDNYGACALNNKIYPRSAAEERLLKSVEEHKHRRQVEADKKIRDARDHIDPVKKLKWKQMLDCER